MVSAVGGLGGIADTPRVILNQSGVAGCGHKRRYRAAANLTVYFRARRVAPPRQWAVVTLTPSIFSLVCASMASWKMEIRGEDRIYDSIVYKAECIAHANR